MANVTFPGVYQRFLNGVNVLNFDFSWVASSGCVLGIDFHDRLLVSTIAPIVAVILIRVTYSVALRMHRGSKDALEVVWQKHVSVALLVTFLVYSSVSSVVFQTFGCESLDDGKKYLRADYSIDCDTSKHEGLRIYAGLMVVLYPVGIPAMYAFLLFRNRTVLQDADMREREVSVKPISDLWKQYKPSQFHYEVIECGRRILLTVAVVFIYPNTSAQIAVTLVVAFVFFTISEILVPYSSTWDNWLNRTAQVIVFFSMYLALLLKVDVSNERKTSQKTFEVVLVTAHVLLVLAVVSETVIVAYTVRPQPRDEENSKACVSADSILDEEFELGIQETHEL